MNAAGVGWLAACTAALVQALLGRPPFEPSVLSPVLILAGLAVWAAGAAYSIISTHR